MTDTNSTLPRRQLGRYLREARTALNMSLEKLADLTDLSSSVLQRLEQGQATRVKVRDVQAVCEALDLPDDMSTAMVGLLQQTAEKSWWHEYGHLIPANFDVFIALETAALSLTMYQPALIPGLLQTADYARALMRTGYPAGGDDEHNRRVELRVKRQAIVTRKRRPTMLEVVLHESALRTIVGGRHTMSAQLRYLAEVGKLPNVTIHVLPFSTGAPIGDPIGQFTVLAFGEDTGRTPSEPPIVYIETFTGCMYLEKPQDVQRYYRAHDSIRRAALDETASRSLIRQVAKELSI